MQFPTLNGGQEPTAPKLEDLAFANLHHLGDLSLTQQHGGRFVTVCTLIFIPHCLLQCRHYSIGDSLL